MAALKIYTQDLEIARLLINRDEQVTHFYYYEQCYPLFKSIYDNYYTDCKSCREFMDEIYILIIVPSKTTGRCQMENFNGESTLTSWLKTVCLYYCYQKYALKKRGPLSESVFRSAEKQSGNIDRIDSDTNSIEMEFSTMNKQDAETLLNMMHNANYRKLIRLRYLEQMTNEETAKKLGLTMANYYNMHKRAKEQYEVVCRKEESHG